MRRYDESIEDLERELEDTRALLAHYQAIEAEARDAAGRRQDQDTVIRVLRLTSPDRRIVAASVLAAVDEDRVRRAERRLERAPAVSSNGGTNAAPSSVIESKTEKKEGGDAR